MNVRGRSLELYFIDGNPEGMLTAEVFIWTGHVLVIPRTRITEGLSRKEAAYTGVYLLIGEVEGQPCVYIGEAEDVASRIRSHDARKDWWTSVVVVTSTANNLHKAHVKYLEARLVEEARKVGRVPLDNGNTPPRSSLSEASQSNMEAFLETLFIVLPALRIDMFLSGARPAAKESAQKAEVVEARFELNSAKAKVKARAILQAGEFIVLKGSTARKEWSGVEVGYTKLYAELRATGVLVPDGETCKFSENYAFASASAAAAVVLGRSANGTLEWQLEGSHLNYKQWENELLQASSEESA